MRSKAVFSPMMGDAGPETNDELKGCSFGNGTTITSVHGVSTIDLLDAMMEGPEKAGLSSGVQYAAADQKGKVHNSASKLAKLAQDWLLFFPWLFYRAVRSPQSGISTPTLPVPEVVADTVRATSRVSQFRNSISERNGDQCAVTGALNMLKGPYPPDTEADYLKAAHIL